MFLIPLVVRATFNATGAITFTGNTLGLSRSENAGVPGTQDSIGAFAAAGTTSAYGSYPAGTTSLYQSNRASAILNLPSGSTVLYAELIWGGSYINGNVNLSSAINNPVTFTTPAGTSTISPDSATSNQVDLGNGAFAYVRSANVTTLVQQGGSGTYSTGNVVGTIVIPGDSTANHAGWTLGVIYQNPALPFRNMSIRAGAVLVQASSGPVLTTITGFATPISGSLGGRALFSAQEGDANRTGDQALFGPTSSTLVALSGPNNFATNFFASQINNDAGQLDTTGTFGSRNQINGTPGSNISGGRQGWDITNVDVSARLVNNQSSAVLSLTTSGDAYVVNGNAIQVDINAPKISVTKSANTAGTLLGDTVTYTVTVSNTGTANAASIVLSDTMAPGLTFVPGSVIVAGTARPTYDVTTGAALGTLNLNSSVTVTYRATITSVPNPQQVVNTANAAFTFQSVAGGPIISGVIPSNGVTLPVYSPRLAIAKTASTANATVGSTVTYTLAVSNAGNIGAVTTLTDNIPAGSTFVPGSFRVNGVVVPGANPAAGVSIGTVGAGTTVNVTFQVVVNTLPSPPQLVDQAAAAYTFSPPDGRTASGSAASNTLTIPVSLPNVSVVKSANFTDAAVGEVLTYTSVISNNGLESITNVILTDPIPSGASFVSGSVIVNGSPLPAAIPSNGIAIGTIAAGSSVTTVFQVNVNSLPSPAQLANQSSAAYNSGTFTGISISNSTITPVYQPVISLVKNANTSAATVGDTVQYSVNVSNTGNISAAVTLTDNVPAGMAFVPNSVTVNGVSQPGASPVTGIPVGAVNTGGSTVITFQFVLNSLPSPPTLSNQAAASYTYQLPSGRGLSGSVTSNTVAVPASAPNVSISKTASLSAVSVNEELLYTIAVMNNGAAPVSNAVVSDAIPAGSVFVAGSVTINGAPAVNANPSAGILLGTVSPGASLTVSFRVRITQLPDPAQLANRASVGFTSGSFSGTSLSNTLLTPVYQPIVAITKSASTVNATVGDTFTYLVQLSNSGNIAAAVTLTDPIPAGASYEVNSVIIDGNPVPGVSPETGIPVGTVQPGSIVTVSFVATVTSLPPSRQLVNQASASYTYTLPDNRQLAGSAASNSLAIPVSSPNVSVIKSASPSSVVTNDILTFSSVVRNNGIANINNVVFSDALQSNVSLISGSVLVNGSSRPLANPSAGIPIGTLAPAAEATVTFEVRIIMPIPSQINNQATVSFTSGTFSSSSSSNVTSTPVIQPQISLSKAASTNNATVGDTVSYTVTITNSGNLEAAQLVITDPIPAGTSFVPNSVIIGGTPAPGASPETGITVGTVAPAASVDVTFSVIVSSLPTPQLISNQAAAAYTFTPPDGRVLNGSAASNTVSFPVSSPNVAVTKSTPSTAVSIGDTITYTVVAANNGIANVTNLLLTDTIPTGASFVPGSVTINGAASPASNPATGIALGSLPPAGTSTTTFDITVNSVPNPAELSNQAAVSFTSGAFSGTSFSNITTTPVYQPSIQASKSANTLNATVGDTLVYSFNIGNTGNYPATVTLTDPLSPNTTFITNSVLINGSSLAGADPATGINVGTIGPGTTVNVMFSVVIDSLPTPQQLVNQGTAAYAYTLPDGRTLTGSAVSNTVTVAVSSPNLSVVKSSTTTATTVGDTVVFTTTLTNLGIASVTNVIFTDPIPGGTALVPDSVTVDGAPRPGANPAAGVIIGSIAPGGAVTVSFSVNVTELPASRELTNQSSVSFTSGAFSAVTFSNTIAVPVYQPVFSAVKTANTANATVGDTVAYTITLSNTGNYGALFTLSDTIPAGTTFVPNSVLLNGSSVPGADPSAGIPLGVVSTTVVVTFSVIVDSLPPNQQLTNQASASYAYTLPDGRTFNGTLASNTLVIPVSAPDVDVVKSVSAADAVPGDTLVYSISVTNSGIQNVNNVVLSDIIPAGASFVPESVTVNGTPRPAASPSAGISLGTIAPGDTVNVAFSINIISLPSPAQLNNQASVSFTSGAFAATTLSNTVVTPVYQPIIALTKSADTTNATVGDTVTYFINAVNNGNLAADVTVTDNIPTGAVIVPNSVLVNGMPVPGADPTTGIPIGSVPPGGLVSIQLSLQVNVVSLPSPQQLVNQARADYTYSPPDGRQLTGFSLSNQLVIPVSDPNVTVAKSTSAIDAVVGDIITYTIVVTNNGLTTVNNVVLVDPVPAGTVFTAGSVTVDGTPRPAANPNTGITIGSITSGGASTVTFQVEVVSL